jgi:hypothetical protein
MPPEALKLGAPGGGLDLDALPTDECAEALGLDVPLNDPEELRRALRSARRANPEAYGRWLDRRRQQDVATERRLRRYLSERIGQTVARARGRFAAYALAIPARSRPRSARLRVVRRRRTATRSRSPGGGADDDPDSDDVDGSAALARRVA